MSYSHIKEHEWQDGLCSFCDGGHCLAGCFCPCILVNKTHELLEDPHKQDPDGCGCVGCGWCVLNMCGGWGFIVGLIQRGKIRDKYRIEGGGGLCGDIMTNLCCPCCSVIQQYKEVEMRRDAAGPSKMGYQAQAPMRASGH